MPSKRGLPFQRGLVGEPEGSSFGGIFERKKYIWVPFLDPKVMKILIPSKALASLGHTHLGSFFFGPGEY